MERAPSPRAETGKYAGLVILPWLVGILAFWLIVAGDPYHIGNRGTPYRIADHRYPDTEWPRLITLATATPHDLVILGGSTAMPITREMLQQAFPAERDPINLSYLAPRPADTLYTLPRIAAVPGLKHFIYYMDFTLLERGSRLSAAGEALEGMANTSWSHRSDFSFVTALATLQAFRSGVFDSAFWAGVKQPDFMTEAKPVTDLPRVMKQFRSSVQEHAADVFAKSSVTCNDIPFIERQLSPFLNEMSRRHVKVDLVFPAVPYILYYDWIDHRPPSNFTSNTLSPGPVYDQFMVYRRCVIAAVERVASDNIRVIAIDTSDTLSGDLSLYFDSLHLIDPGAQRRVTQMIAAGDRTLTSANIDEYDAELRDKVTAAAARLRDGDPAKP